MIHPAPIDENGKILTNPGLDKLTSTRNIYAPDRTQIKKKKKKKGAQKQTQCPRLIEKQLETTFFVLYYINRACSFHCHCFFIRSLCNEAFAV